MRWIQIDARLKIVRLRQNPSPAVYRQAARLHIDNIHHGLLPMLGENFLSRLYCELDRSPGAGVWGAIYDGKVIGFLAGSINVGKSYLWLIIRKGIPLSMAIPASAVKWSVFYRMGAVLAHPFRLRSKDPDDRKEKVGKAEILAVAVDADYRKKGIARQLVSVYQRNMKKWGFRGYYFVSTNVSEKDSNAFYRNLGFQPLQSIKHNNLILQVYQKKIGEQSDD